MFLAIKCGANQVYTKKTQCSNTCLFPTGKYDCGIVSPIEGCFCAPGFILDTKNNCVRQRDCGCKLPDKSGFIAVSTFLKNSNNFFLN